MRRLMFLAGVMTLLVVFVATGSAVKPDKPPKAGAALTVAKTAFGHWTRSFDWTIGKAVADDTLTLSGGEAVADYTVTVVKGDAIDTFFVDGDVCVTNTGDRDSDLLTITDTIFYRVGGKGKPLTLAETTVDTLEMPSLEASASYCYPYSIEFTPVAGASYFNEAEVAAGIGKGKNGKATAKAAFILPAAPDATVNDSVKVDDEGDTFPFSDSGTASYLRTYTSAGTYTNTATIRGAGQSASATVTVTVGCSTSWDAVAYWCFDDMADPTMDGADGHDANVVGSVYETADIAPMPGNVAALRFDGIDDYAWTPDPGGDNNLDGFPGLTLAAWVNLDGAQFPAGPAVISKYNTNANTISYYLSIEDQNEVEVYVALQRPGNEDKLKTTSANLVSGTWNHIAGTWDGKLLRVYVNGDLVASKTTSVLEMDDRNIQVDIGAAESNLGGSRFAFFKGMIDEAYVFDRALSPADIARLAGNTPTADWHVDLVFNWLEEGGNSRYSFKWTPGLGFESVPVDETCVAAASPFAAAPSNFPYQTIDATYTANSSVQFDFAYPLRPVQAWLHTADGACHTPDAQGGGLPGDEWFFEFTLS